MKKYSGMGILFAGFFILPALPLYASTIVSTDIVQNTTWNSSGNPYLIDNPIVIRPEATLTVNPGVIIKSNALITILGKITVLGTENNPIVFTSKAADSTWGIDFTSASSSQITYASIEKADRGIAINNSPVSLDHIQLTNSMKGISVFNGSTVMCERCIVKDLQTSQLFSYLSVYDTRDTGSSTLVLKDSILENGTGYGVAVYGNGRLIIETSTLQNFLGDGIVGYGMSDTSITDSILRNNQNGLQIYDDAAVSISSSTIELNRDFGILSRSQKIAHAENNWWGTSTGPYQEDYNVTGKGNAVSGSVDFTPWKETIDPVATLCCSNILFIPGFQASRLYVKGQFFENQLWEPNRNKDVEKLFLDTDSKPITENIYTRDIITSTNYPGFNKDIYKSFSHVLDEFVQNNVIRAWNTLPYDWRFDTRDLASDKNITAYILQLAKSSRTGKVTLITHSNGGLYAKALVKALEASGQSSLIDKVIMVAAPQLGTPQTIAALLHGDNQSLGPLGILMDASTARTLGSTLPGAYNLLPSDSYTSLTMPVITFDESVDSITNLRKKYGNTITTYKELSDFLLAIKDSRAQPTKTNTDEPAVLYKKILDKAKELHKEFDNYIFPRSIDVYNLVGTGIKTVQGIRYKVNNHCIVKACLDHQPLFSTAGDGTVLSRSTYVPQAKNIFIDLYNYNAAHNENRNHGDIFEVKDVLSILKSLITNSLGVTNNNNEAHQYYSIGVHSPVSLDLFDNEGRHTGMVTQEGSTTDISFIDEQIPNSYYRSFGEGHYAGSAEPVTVQLAGTGNGTFSVDVTSSHNGIDTVSQFIDVPVFTTTQASLQLGQNNPVTLEVDYEGDGHIDEVITEKKEQDFKKYLQAARTIIEQLGIKELYKQQLLQRLDRLSKLIEKDKTKKLEKRIKIYLTSLTHKSHHSKHVSQQDGIAVSELFEQLLNAFEQS